MSLSSPRIVCAAVLYSVDGKPFIVAGPRHFDHVMHPVIELLVETVNPDGLRPVQGFIDQHGEFYNRKNAWPIAERNGQIVKRVGGDGPDQHGLFSENLY